MRYRLLKAKYNDGTVFYAVVDSAFDVVVATGTLDEMKEYKKVRKAQDKISQWN